MISSVHRHSPVRRVARLVALAATLAVGTVALPALAQSAGTLNAAAV